MPWIHRFFYRHHAAIVLRSLSHVVEGNQPLDRGLLTLSGLCRGADPSGRLGSSGSNRDIRQGDDWCFAFARAGLVETGRGNSLGGCATDQKVSWALPRGGREQASDGWRTVSIFVAVALP